MSRKHAKPCPFCGGIRLQTYGDRGDFYVECLNDNCMVAGPAGVTRQQAVDKWNKRKPK
jgi:Lar family restriction alleviation protein